MYISSNATLLRKDMFAFLPFSWIRHWSLDERWPVEVGENGNSRLWCTTHYAHVFRFRILCTFLVTRSEASVSKNNPRV